MAIAAASVWAIAVVGWLVSPIINLLLRKMLSRLGFDASHKLLELEIRIVPELKGTKRALCQQAMLAVKQATTMHIKFKKKFGPVVLTKMVEFGRMEAMLIHALEDAEDIFRNQQEIRFYRSRCWHGLYRCSASCIARFKSSCHCSLQKYQISSTIAAGVEDLLWWVRGSTCGLRWTSSGDCTLRFLVVVAILLVQLLQLLQDCYMSIFYWLVHAIEAAHAYRNWSYAVVGITGYQVPPIFPKKYQVSFFSFFENEGNASMLDFLLITISRRNLKKRIEKIESTVSDVKESLLVLSVARKRASQFLSDSNDNASEEDTNESDENASEEDSNEYDGNASEEDSNESDENASEEDSNEYDGNASEEDSNEYDGSASEENSNESDGSASEEDSNESDGTASEEHSNQSGGIISVLSQNSDDSDEIASEDSLTLDFSEEGYELKQQRDLNKVFYNLEIYGLEKVKSTDEALEANLAAKEQLIKLTLDWGDVDDGTRCSPEVEAEILEVLCPPVGLFTLYIGGYKGSRYPDWMVGKPNGSTKDLQKLVLGGWSQLGPGPELEAFPHLRLLELVSCSWDALPNNMEGLTSLKRLEILYCDNIRSLPTLPQSLVEFILIDCDYELMEFCQTVGHPYWQKIEHIPNKIFNVNFNSFPASDDSQEINASSS